MLATNGYLVCVLPAIPDTSSADRCFLALLRFIHDPTDTSSAWTVL